MNFVGPAASRSLRPLRHRLGQRVRDFGPLRHRLGQRVRDFRTICRRLGDEKQRFALDILQKLTFAKSKVCVLRVKFRRKMHFCFSRKSKNSVSLETSRKVTDSFSPTTRCGLVWRGSKADTPRRGRTEASEHVVQLYICRYLHAMGESKRWSGGTLPEVAVDQNSVFAGDIPKRDRLDLPRLAVGEILVLNTVYCVLFQVTEIAYQHVLSALAWPGLCMIFSLPVQTQAAQSTGGH